MRDCFITAVAVLLGLSVGGRAVAGGTGVEAVAVVRVDAHSGHLVRRIVVRSPRGRKAFRSLAEAWRRSGELDRVIERAAKRYHLDPLLVRSVIEVESGYNPFAVSPKGARGLMQLIPATARRFGVHNSFDPRQNVEAGARYLKYLQDLFRDDHLALAAYNAGEGAVARYRRIPPYGETEQYVERVKARYAQLKEEAGREAASGWPAETRQRYRPVEVSFDSQGRLQLRTR